MQYLLDVHEVSKAFGGVQALKQASLHVAKGEIHALVGENGAGKSTLMKILAGVHGPDQGHLAWRGEPLVVRSPAEAQRVGISIIYQEFNLLPDLSVAENVLLDQEPSTRFGLIDWRAMRRSAEEILGRLDAAIHPAALVRDLSVAQQQLVEIAKALTRSARLIIMDEPTAALTPSEVDHLFDRMRALRDQDTSIIFISHRLEEVLTISDRVTVLKDGEVVATRATEGCTEEWLVSQMVGRDLTDLFPPRIRTSATSPRLSVSGLANERLSGIEFDLYPGEILGVAGLEGQGQRELARALFGLEPFRTGEIRIDGESVRIRHPRDAIRAGIAFVSEDRKREGLALDLDVGENVALPNLARWTRLGLVNDKSRQSDVSTVVERLGVKTPSLRQAVRNLSGGNQQKAVLAKWLIDPPRVILFAEPTRGIDVGAKAEIYALMHDLARNGAAILMVSSDLLELLGLSSRVLVVRDGRVVHELPGDDATEEAIMSAATSSAA